MTTKRFLTTLFGLFVISQISVAAEVDPFAPPMPLYAEGPHYTIDFPDAAPEKPTVVEFFSFGCPHCYTREADVLRWKAGKPDNVNFIKVPVSFGRPQWTLFAKAYYLSIALKMEDKFIGPFFNLIHTQNRAPNTVADVKNFYASIGVSAEKFDNAFKKHSFFIENSIRKADQLARKYRVAGVPDFLINYKYRLGKEIRSENDFQALLNGLALKDFK